MDFGNCFCLFLIVSFLIICSTLGWLVVVASIVVAADVVVVVVVVAVGWLIDWLIGRKQNHTNKHCKKTVV